MLFRTTLALLLMACSINQQSSNDGLQAERGLNPPPLKTGLRIDQKPTRGQSYTDSLGVKYALRHIPAIITNDSTIPIHVQITFSREYDYPMVYNKQQFKVFPMPEIWALDGVEITDSILHAIPKYINQPVVSKTLAPGEKWLLAFGTLYLTTVNYGVFPIAIFSHNNRALYPEGARLTDPNNQPVSPLSLELLVGFTSGSQASPESHATINCGQISYPKN